MDCQICRKEFAEWQCQSCKKVIGTKCARPHEKGVYCYQCEPDAVKGKKPKAEVPKEVKTALMTLIILDIGLGFIMFIMETMIGDQDVDVPVATGLITTLKTTGYTILLGMIGLTVLLGILYIFYQRKEVG